MKICLVCSAGGHLTEMRQLETAYKKYRHFFIVPERSDTIELSKKESVFFVPDVSKNPAVFVKNFILSKKILSKEKPHVLISTGAGAAMPALFAGKALGIKIIFIESLARTKDLSVSGKFAYKLADLFLVQWPELAKKYPKSKFWEAVI